MNELEAINALLAGLRRSGSLEAALNESVRLSCEASGCAAAALAVDPNTGPGPAWYGHDPGGVMDATRAARSESRLGNSAHASARTDPASAPRPPGPSDPSFDEVRVPIVCGKETVAGLVLLAEKGRRLQDIPERISALTCLMGVLFGAAESAACDRNSAVLNRSAFRTRVASELARGRRCAQEFSLVSVCPGDSGSPDGHPGRAAMGAVAAMAEALSRRLRRSDVVGLSAPDRLTVLLTATGRAGARIASRRIEKLVMERIENAHGSTRPAAAPRISFLVFPADEKEIERCGRSSSDAGAGAGAGAARTPTLAAGVAE